MTTTSVPTPGSQNLDTFQTVVQQMEGIFGPLASLDNDGVNNLLTFEVGASPDSNHRAVLAVYTGVPPHKPEFVLVCTGACLIEGTLKAVAAYRKTP